MSCSDSDLQVFDLKAAAALRVSHTAGTDYTGSFRVKLAQPSMHHAPTRSRPGALRGPRAEDALPQAAMASQRGGGRGHARLLSELGGQKQSKSSGYEPAK